MNSSLSLYNPQLCIFYLEQLLQKGTVESIRDSAVLNSSDRVGRFIINQYYSYDKKNYYNFQSIFKTFYDEFELSYKPKFSSEELFSPDPKVRFASLMAFAYFQGFLTFSKSQAGLKGTTYGSCSSFNFEAPNYLYKETFLTELKNPAIIAIIKDPKELQLLELVNQLVNEKDKENKNSLFSQISIASAALGIAFNAKRLRDFLAEFPCVAAFTRTRR